MLDTMTRQEKAIRFMLRNEDYKWDSRAKLENLNDGAGLTFAGLTERDDTKYLPSDCPTIRALAELYKVDKCKAITIIITTYIKAYWNPKYNELINERLAIRLFDLGVNMGVGSAVKLLQRGLNDLGANLKADGQFGPATLVAANHYSLVGDDVNVAMTKSFAVFAAIYGKMKEIIGDVQTSNFAELAIDTAELAQLAKDAFGKMVDNDVLKELVEEAKERYEDIAQKPKFERFLNGWMNRLNKDEYSI